MASRLLGTGLILGTRQSAIYTPLITACVIQKAKTGDDRIALKGTPNAGVMVVTDGVGSLPNSAKCADTLSTHFASCPPPISHADITRELQSAQKGFSDNGATATLVAAIHGQHAIITSIGDPQAFLFDSRGNLKEQTHPNYTPSQYTHSMSKHHFPKQLSHHQWKLEKGDLLLACTDGIGDNISLEGIKILARGAQLHGAKATFGTFNEALSLYLEAPDDSSGELMRAARQLTDQLGVTQHLPLSIKKDDRSLAAFRIF
jgi:serine/threonine protein phosphatase PrpC